jgi:thioesterase domain-containing protein
MKIISDIKENLTENVTIRTIFECPTIKKLANKIKGPQGGTTACSANCHSKNFPIIHINGKGGKTPLFLVHPIGGSIFWYKRMSEYLDYDRPIFGIQDPGLESNEFCFHSLEEMAAYYVNAIQSIQPNGPYLLGGASFGTTVVVEMAKQLQEQGEMVHAILSYDGWAYYPSLQSDEANFRKIMDEQNSRLLKNNSDIHIENFEFLLKLQWHREQMLMQYKLPMIEAKFILFKAQKLSKTFQYIADFNWWDSFTTRPIDLHLVPGDHESMFSEPHVRVLSHKINEALNNISMAPKTLEKDIVIYGD